MPDSLIEEMAGQGLAGLEADHEDHTPEQRAQVRGLAGRLGLLVTGSSDFHGANKTVALGANLTEPAVLGGDPSAGRAAAVGTMIAWMCSSSARSSSRSW